MLKDERIIIRVTANEKKIIQKKAKERKVSLSKYVLSRALIDNDPQLKKLIADLIQEIKNTQNR